MSAVTLQPTPALVVFGRDHAGKPHASWFDQASAELATKAAAMMNMEAVPVDGDELRDLVGRLPRGRVFSSGKAFTPFINGTLYTRLVELTRGLLGLQSQSLTEAAGEDASNEGKAIAAAATGDQAPPADRPTGQAAASPSLRPTRPEEIGLNSLVLATTGPAEGWYEAHVIGVNGGMFTLKFRDYAEPTVVRRLAEIGFLPPAQS